MVPTGRDAAGRWARISLATTSATHSWTTAAPTTWDDLTRWAAVADAAALAGAVAVLDWHLAAAAPSTETRHVLVDATVTPLLPIAWAVTALASADTVTPWDIQEPDSTAPHVVQIGSPDDIPGAQAALTSWIRRGHLSPADTDAVLASQLHLSRLVDAGRGPSALTTALTRAREAHRAFHPRPLRTTRAHGATLQASEIARSVRRIAETPTDPSQRAAAKARGQTPVVIHALCAEITRAVLNRDWGRPNRGAEEPGAPLYVVIADPPRYVTALQAAVRPDLGPTPHRPTHTAAGVLHGISDLAYDGVRPAAPSIHFGPRPATPPQR